MCNLGGLDNLRLKRKKKKFFLFFIALLWVTELLQGRSIPSDKGEGATGPRDDLEPPQITAIAKAAQSQALGEGFTEAGEQEEGRDFTSHICITTWPP